MTRGDSTGFLSLDPFFNVRRGEWTLVSGIPRHGKSSFVDNLIVNLADRKGWRWLIYSPENHPLERHASQLAEIYIGRSFRPGPRTRMTQEDFVYASAFLDTQVQFLELQSGQCNIESILDFAAGSRCDGIVIDPWNRLQHRRGPNVSETEYIGAALAQISGFVREYKKHVFLIAHPAKMMRIKTGDPDKPESTSYPVPTPYDVSGSAHWINMSDNCLCVWRRLDDPRSDTEIHVQKVRFRENGQIGMCRLSYDPANGQYIDRLSGPRPAFDVETYSNRLQSQIDLHEEELARAEAELVETERKR